MSDQLNEMRQRIQEAQDLQEDFVETPEWGAGMVIKVKSMNAADRNIFMMSMVDLDSGETVPDHMLVQLVVACARHPETDEKLFTQDDVGWIGGKHGAVVERIATAAMKVSGVSADAVDEAGKGLSNTLSAVSSSSSATG